MARLGQVGGASLVHVVELLRTKGPRPTRQMIDHVAPGDRRVERPQTLRQRGELGTSEGGPRLAGAPAAAGEERPHAVFPSRTGQASQSRVFQRGEQLDAPQQLVDPIVWHSTLLAGNPTFWEG